MNSDRALMPESLLAGLATMAAAWPLTALLAQNDWAGTAILLIALVAVVGSGLRAVGIGPTLVVLGQSLAALLALTLTYLPDTLWYGLPTVDTANQAGELLREAGRVLQNYAAPAPATPGVIFLVVSVLTLTAVSVDAIGVTGRAPATAGIPLAAAFLVSVSNNGQAMAPQYFIALGAVWLAMLAQQGNRIVTAWSSADRRESIGSHDVSAGPTRYLAVAQVLGAVTVVGAVIVASVIPHQPPTFFGTGLARNDNANDLGTGGQVGFTQTMDLAADLNSRSELPVLTYRDSSYPIGPLRVTSTQIFDGRKWQPSPEPDTAQTAEEVFTPPVPAGLAEGVPRAEARMDVLSSSLRPPHLAAATPVMQVRAQEGAYWDPITDSVKVAGPAESYEVTYLHVAPYGKLPKGIGAQPADPADFADELLKVDPNSFAAVSQLADKVVGEETNSFQTALLIQNHLRGGLYTYSLTLAPGGDLDDPITHFLSTRKGYCVQFATAMVMMARHEGIPARMAVGFIPGKVQVGGTRVVARSDAHSWPELWIDGLGWTRFEPTPGRATTPSYAQQQAQSSAPEPIASGSATKQPTVTKAPATNQDEPNWWESLGPIAPDLGRGLLLLTVLALLMAMVPLAARRHREAGLRAARTPVEHVEGQWQYFTRSMEDLGIEPPPARSPREMHRHYAKATQLNRRGGEALGRATATLERARYAPDTSTDEKAAATMGRDVRSVIDTVTEDLPWNIRANSRLLPRTGFRTLGERLTFWRR